MENDTQTVDDGVGPLYHRIYSIRFRASRIQAEKIMARLQADPNVFSPQWLAEFSKMSGQPAKMKIGDEFQVYIAGPWNGPVRVTEVTPLSFCLATLKGHMEAGEIHFQITLNDEDHACFQIESYARSRDSLVDFVYDKIPVARAAQTSMWEQVCQAVAAETAFSLADIDGEVKIRTEKQIEGTGQWNPI